MRWSDLKESISEFLFEFKKQKGGILGVILLVLLVLTAIAAPYITEPNIPEKWSDSQAWLGNPTNVPPAWYNMFTSKKLSPHEIVTVSDPDIKIEQVDEKTTVVEVTYTFEDYYYGPKAIIIKGFNTTVKNKRKPVKMTLTLERPDGREITFFERKSIRGSTVIQVGKDAEISKEIYKWLYYETTGEEISEMDIPLDRLLITDMVQPLFSVVEGKTIEDVLKNPEPLHGTYTLKMKFTKVYPEDTIDLSNMEVLFVGRAYGTMGTDYLGRDLWAGLVWGSRVSLVIGILVSLISTVIGIVYGVTSAYLGGNVDELMMRINEIFSSIPRLPILILLGATIKGHITLGVMVFLLVIFGWMGVARVARSMALQIKEQIYIEAARALGAGNGRIIIKHMLPQLLPYAFAVIALGVPGAVIAEASLSFLGLGDPTQVTWGQILNAAQTQGATLKGYWWWVIPPGLGIALVGLTFVLIGTALDKILNPRLRRL
ncbi:hypothetical protein PAP_10200 [Palaeococcus pacificus DY20341]|uniref:ABC transmembrane type-1 domain-containing protein n=1 Tax=Palaeococcus pacificus DY20341 TaxID=1343739 RepID=A0A075LW28_9EURY|nr:ABC transporter permease [Palaeococcus pacificus]AIF70411.1 hypothetical protein PAP_10200 [Palaeococcus pacificus DY20341]